MREGSWQVPGLGSRHEATLVAKLVPGGLSDPPVFSPRRRQLLAALGPCSCAVPAASRQRLRQSVQLAPHQPSDHEEQLFATAPIDPGQPRVQSNHRSLFAHLGKRASESKRRILLQRHSIRGCTGRRFHGQIAFRGAVARKVRLRFWLVRHSNACFAAELDRKRFVAAVSRTSFVRAEVLQSCYHCPRAYCCGRTLANSVALSLGLGGSSRVQSITGIGSARLS